MPPFEVDGHSIGCIYPAAINEYRTVGAGLFQWSDDVHARRSVSGSIRENDFVFEIVDAAEIDSPEVCCSSVSRELTEVDCFGFGSRSQLAIEGLSLLESGELPESESYTENCEYDSESRKNFVSCFHISFV